MQEQIQYMSTKQIINDGRFSFTMGMVRHYLLHRHTNGLEKAIRKIGKRLLIRVDLFEAWIEKQTRRGGVQ